MATLQARLGDLITAIGTDWKTIWANTGAKGNLNTTAKTSLVDAINEVKITADSAAGGGVAINDSATTSTTQAFSANKINTLDAQNVKITGAQSISGIKTFVSAPAVPDSSFTIAKTTGLQAALDAKPVIADGSATTATTTTYSANKINAAITAAVASLVGSAGATLDTLQELAAALGNDASFSTTITTALGNRVRYDAAQTLTAPQKVQAKANIDAYGSLEIGNPDTDLVALYTTAKA